jgi:hypothetical protein
MPCLLEPKALILKLKLTMACFIEVAHLPFSVSPNYLDLESSIAFASRFRLIQARID